MPVVTNPIKTGVPTIEPYSSFASFPASGNFGTIYLDTASADVYLWNGTAFELSSGGGGGGAWGSITGTLSAQTDLQNALNAKETILDPAVDPDRYFIYQTDFMEADRAGLVAAASTGGGAGQLLTNDATTLLNTTENPMGLLEFILGTGTTARLSVYPAGQAVTGAHTLDFGVRACMSSGLSDGTNTFTTYLGWADNPGAGDMTDGAYFRYTHSVNGGRWEAVVAKAGVRVAADTTIAPVNQVFQSFKIVINQAGTQALFYIDGTLTNTVSSGLPGAGDFFGWVTKIEKSAGGTSRSLLLDWVYYKITRSSTR